MEPARLKIAKGKLRTRKPPFIPPYSEDGEPAYLNEWLESDSSVQVLGSACLSMAESGVTVPVTLMC